MTKLVPIIRWMATLLLLSLAIVALTACGDSPPTQLASEQQPPIVQPDPENDQPAPTNVRSLSDGDRPTSLPSGPSPTDTPEPTVAVVPVSSGDVSAPLQQDRQPIVPSTEASTPESSGTPSADAADIDPALLLAAFEQVLNDIYVSALPSVVYIRVPNPAASSLRDLPGVPDDLLWGAGSGFVWDEEGHIITNHHVVEEVADGSQEVTVIFSDGRQAQARVIGSDPHSDLAVIKLEGGDWVLSPVPLGDSEVVEVGQLTVAIGAPFGQEFTMTSGIVSALGRNISGQSQFTIPEVIQTDAAVNPGNSGGPLLDRLGRVIGINTQIISRSGNFSGVGMAVPVNIAKRVVPPLIEDGRFNYPWLGVSIATLSHLYVEELGLPDGTKGSLVISIVDDGPAHKAGLRGSDETVELNGVDYPAGGDIIVAVGSHEITSSNALIAHLTYHNHPGDVIVLSALRDGQLESFEVTLGERPNLP